jgi:hypothetical protein
MRAGWCCTTAGCIFMTERMIPKSVKRFSEKVMRKEKR